MIRVPNAVALFKLESGAILPSNVYKTDGDASDENGPHNRYVYLDGELRLIASIWDRKFLRFETPAST